VRNEPQRLAPELIERILIRLGLSARPEPTFGGLRLVYAAWCRNVPFDNVRKLIHLHRHDPRPLPGDDPRDFFGLRNDQWIVRWRPFHKWDGMDCRIDTLDVPASAFCERALPSA
jgi:hypothetical protein